MHRPAIFHPAAKAAIREFPPEVRRSIGQAIWDLQRGIHLGMPLSKRMPTVGRGVEELRVKDASGAYRAFYFVRSLHGVLIFHAFQKKSRQTPRADILLGGRRLKELLNETT